MKKTIRTKISEEFMFLQEKKSAGAAGLLTKQNLKGLLERRDLVRRHLHAGDGSFEAIKKG